MFKKIVLTLIFINNSFNAHATLGGHMSNDVIPTAIINATQKCVEKGFGLVAKGTLILIGRGCVFNN